MNRHYSFADESNAASRQKRRRNWHTPQSRANAQSGTLGSYASITTRYNNVYGKQKNNSDANEQEFSFQ